MKQETIFDLILNPSPVKGEKKYFIDRWGTVYDRNPNLPEKKEEAPKEEPSSLWREGDR